MTDYIAAIEAALAAGPTPGPWLVGDDYGTNEAFVRWQLGCAAISGSRWRRHANAAYIAACHPDAIRSIFARLREAEADAQRLAKLCAAVEWDGDAYWIPDLCVKTREWGQEYTRPPSIDEFRAAVDAIKEPK